MTPEGLAEELFNWNCPASRGFGWAECPTGIKDFYLGQAEKLLDALPRLRPTHPLERAWKTGERVELVEGGYGGSPRTTRPGLVHGVTRTYGYHETLVVAFDDGETRGINPDVMRHRRGKDDA